MKRVALVLSLLCTSLSVGAVPQSAIARKTAAPFTAICVEEQSNGFKWTKGAWEATNFKADEKFLIEKIPVERYKDQATPFCKERAPLTGPDYYLGYGCYNLRELGEELQPYESRMCSEWWQGDTLEKISCDEAGLGAPYFFRPDGNFIRYPWHSDISQNPKKDYKDSLALSVGKCSVVAR